MVRLDKVIYRLITAAALVVLLYWLAGWDLQEPCAVFGFLGIFTTLQEWVIEKKKALQLGRANRAMRNKISKTF